ncbi:MAG TPA: NepR family anti-sigma factor [Croceibacterium sp.]|nr:NepR family anti-sigma factor [Croceibacterium sp.]
MKGNKRNTKSTGRDTPEWAAGLKHLYDSVIEEPLPDTFKDLLAKLDDEER